MKEGLSAQERRELKEFRHTLLVLRNMLPTALEGIERILNEDAALTSPGKLTGDQIRATILNNIATGHRKIKTPVIH